MRAIRNTTHNEVSEQLELCPVDKIKETAADGWVTHH